MKEIGGYLQLDKPLGKEYYKDCLSFNSAANALVYFLEYRKVKKIFLPYYLCDSVCNKIDKTKFIIEYYHVDNNFVPCLDIALKRNEYIYIVNYFGQLSNIKIKKLVLKYKNIIIDNVQSFFQKPLENIPTIYSCRKYFGVPDGAYLINSNCKKTKLDNDDSSNRYKHIIGRLDTCGLKYYDDFIKNEEEIEKLECKYMSNSTHNMLASIDYGYVIGRRNSNYKYLDNKLEKYNNLKLNKQNGPYCYPLFVENGEIIRKELIKNKIYVPILWPNVLDIDDCIEKEYSKNILPIPCDQRYDQKDMAYMVDIVIKLIKKYNKVV